MHLLFHNLHGPGVLSWVLCSRSLKAAVQLLAELCSLLELRVLSKNHVAVGRTQFLVVKRLRPLFSSCKLVPLWIPKSYSQFLSSQAPSQRGGLFCQGQQENLCSFKSLGSRTRKKKGRLSSKGLTQGNDPFDSLNFN